MSKTKEEVINKNPPKKGGVCCLMSSKKRKRILIGIFQKNNISSFENIGLCYGLEPPKRRMINMGGYKS